MDDQAILLTGPLADIRANFPALSISTISLAGEGMDSRAFLLNGSLIFRFPKYREVSEQLQVEICLLPRLREKVSLRMPDFTYIGRQQVTGFLFAGYDLIAGHSLASGVMASIGTAARRRLTAAIAGFLCDVHAFPTAVATECKVQVYHFREEYRGLLEEMRRLAYPLLETHLVAYTEALLHAYLDNDSYFSYHPVLLHADLSPDHIMYDAASQQIAGIIDFGDIQIGDPDYDLMYLYSDAPDKTFFSEILEHYPHHDTAKLMRKLDLFSRCNTLEDVLTGIERNDEAILQAGLAQMRAEAATFGG